MKSSIKSSKKPIWTSGKFHSKHKLHQNSLLNYSLTKRGRNIQFSEIERILPRAARHGYAVNVRYRRTFVEFLERTTQLLFAGNSDEQFFFVTFIPGDWAFPLSKLDELDETSIKGQSKQLLRSLNYVAMIDLALYTTGIPGSEREAKVSPHIHALVWGNADSELARLRKTSNKKLKALLPEVEVFHYKHITGAHYREILRYVFKAPLREYRAYRKKGAGETAQVAIGLRSPPTRYQQQKRDLRPGHRWALCRVLGQRSLQTLSFAGGQGEFILPLAFSATNLNISNADEKKLTQQIDAYRQS